MLHYIVVEGMETEEVSGHGGVGKALFARAFVKVNDLNGGVWKEVKRLTASKNCEIDAAPTCTGQLNSIASSQTRI